MNKHTKKRNQKKPVVPPSTWDRELPDGRDTRTRDPKPALNVGELRHGDARTFATFSEDVEELTAFELHGYAPVLQRIRDAQEGGAGAPTSKRRLWCFTHQTDRPHPISKADPLRPCPDLSYYVDHADGPGEAAVHEDQARTHEKAMTDAVAAVHNARIVLMSLGRVYSPRPPTDAERAAMAKANEADEPGCQCCVRIAICSECKWVTTSKARKCTRCGKKSLKRVWSPPWTKGPSTVKDKLAEAMFLCRWCWEFVDRFERPPSEHESREHLDPAVKKVKVQIAKGEFTHV